MFYTGIRTPASKSILYKKNLDGNYMYTDLRGRLVKSGTQNNRDFISANIIDIICNFYIEADIASGKLITINHQKDMLREFLLWEENLT